VLEHVIGFHDVLLLTPFEAKPARPRDDPVARWEVTFEAIVTVLGPDGPLGDAGPGRAGSEEPKISKLLPLVTSDVLVHTWDLSRSIGAEVVLDGELCRMALEGARRNEEARLASGMFGAPVDLPEGADDQSLLVAQMGRDPSWGIA
jgi:hypothetical protein